MTPDQAIALLGPPDQGPTTSFGETRLGWNQGILALFFSEGLDYIELSRDPGVRVELLGIAVFDMRAMELVQQLVEAGHDFDASDPEVGHSYVFPSLQASLWRPTMPDSETDEEGRYFSTVGIGREGYYD